MAANTDLDQCQLHALRIGAEPAPTQPDPRWGVLLDPAGYPRSASLPAPHRHEHQPHQHPAPQASVPP
ncbi:MULTISPECIES: hypothetical protein [Nocardia]|uniref:hypothetical protein n=1 Tax=Nocardia TaxID=1817 RepID=UPI001E2BBEA2|nr:MULTISPECIES: hypothetical protein [Nocardia]